MTALSFGVADELTLSVMTLRNATLAQRIEAAAKAGFAGIGWRLDDFVAAAAAGQTEADITALLESSKIRAVEVEFLRHWVGLEGDPDYRGREDELLSLAGRLGARHVNVAIFDRVPSQEVVAAMKGLCQRAAPYHLIVQLEFMPYSPPVDTLANAWDVVRDVDEPNAGLVIDAWHWGRTPGSAEALALVPPARVTSIQISDCASKPGADLAQESRHNRCVPGQGAMDLPRLLDTLESHGVAAPLSVEVMSDRLDAMTPARAAQEVMDGCRTVLRDRARGQQ